MRHLILKRARPVDFFDLHFPRSLSIIFNMPGLGPSLLFATGLAVGVGAGVLYPRKPTKEVFTPPPPPEGNYRGTPTKVVTPTGGVALQGGFPGEQNPTAYAAFGRDRRSCTEMQARFRT